LFVCLLVCVCVCVCVCSSFLSTDGCLTSRLTSRSLIVRDKTTLGFESVQDILRYVTSNLWLLFFC